PRLSVDARPSDAEIAALDAALPRQPRRVAVVLCGDRQPAGWWTGAEDAGAGVQGSAGGGRTASWADAIQAARIVARAAGVELDVRSDEHAPWHPGRCAALFRKAGPGSGGEGSGSGAGAAADDGVLVGHAGELHPKVVEAYGLPPRACAMELDLDLLGSA